LRIVLPVSAGVQLLSQHLGLNTVGWTITELLFQALQLFLTVCCQEFIYGYDSHSHVLHVE
jgi:hypothetical protein